MRHPYLEGLKEQVTSSKPCVQSFLDRTDDELAWKPNDSSWNVLEVAEHLRITNEAYLMRISEAVAGATGENPDEPFKSGLFARFFFGFVKPDPRIKVKTVAAAIPDRASRESISRLAAQQDRLLEVLEAADQVNLNATRFTSPLSRWVRFSIGEGLMVIVLHQLRHLQQMDRLIGHFQ